MDPLIIFWILFISLYYLLTLSSYTWEELNAYSPLVHSHTFSAYIHFAKVNMSFHTDISTWQYFTLLYILIHQLRLTTLFTPRVHTKWLPLHLSRNTFSRIFIWRTCSPKQCTLCICSSLLLFILLFTFLFVPSIVLPHILFTIMLSALRLTRTYHLKRILSIQLSNSFFPS